MIKLKNILNEIDAQSGEMNSFTGFQLFQQEFDNIPNLDDILEVEQYGFFFTSNVDKISKLMIDADKNKKKMPKEIQNKITKAFGKTIRSTGDIVITHTKNSDYDNAYHVFDFSKPVKIIGRADYYDDNRPILEVNFYVGHILTDNVENDIYYSPKKQLGLSNIQQVHIAELGKEYRGQGYGSLLYDAVAKQVDAIYSDSTLFKSSLAMWTKHMKKVSRFFGANLGGYLIVPVSGEIDKKTIDAADGFVAIFKNVPPKLKEMEKFLSGIPIDNIYVTDDIDNTDVNLKRMVDILDEVTTLSELNETIFDEPLPANYTVGIFLHEKATFVVKEVGEELDYMLI